MRRPTPSLQKQCFQHVFTTLPWDLSYRSMYGFGRVLPWSPCGPCPTKTSLSAWFYYITLGPRLPIYVWIGSFFALVALWPLPYKHIAFSIAASKGDCGTYAKTLKKPGSGGAPTLHAPPPGWKKQGVGAPPLCFSQDFYKQGLGRPIADINIDSIGSRLVALIAFPHTNTLLSALFYKDYWGLVY